MLDHEELLNFSTCGIARYGNQNADRKKNTQIIESYVSDKYKFLPLQLLASLSH